MFHYLNRSGFKICLGCWCWVVLLTHLDVELVGAGLTDDLIPVLYLKYRAAVNNGEGRISIRRLFTDNKQYEIHVKKLKEVNGFKKHNLMIKQTGRSNENPIIYIDNPVESKQPYAYLTLEEFKTALTNRVQAQKDELAANRELVLVRNSITDAYLPTKAVTKEILYTTSTLPNITKLNSIKVKKTNILGIGSTIKDKPIRKSTQNLITETKLKPVVATKYELSINNTVANKLQNITINKIFNQPIENLTQSLESRSIFIEKEVISRKTTEMSKQSNYTVNNTQNTIGIKGPAGTSKDVVFKNGMYSSTFDSSKTKNSTEFVEDVKELIIENNVHETVPFLINTEYPVTYNISTAIADDNTTVIYDKISSTTTEIMALKTKDKDKQTPKRAPVLKKAKEKQGLPTKTTKWKRSTLSRPLVFLE